MHGEQIEIHELGVHFDDNEDEATQSLCFEGGREALMGGITCSVTFGCGGDQEGKGSDKDARVGVRAAS